MPLRFLVEEDLPAVLAWRNAPEIRQSMFSAHVISEAEHRAWFERMQRDPQARWFVHESLDGVADGVVYFSQYAPEQRTAFWGFYCAPAAPKGTGTLLAIEALDHAFGPMRLHKLNAEVLGSNQRSLRFHEKCGFKLEGLFRAAHFTGECYVDVVRYGMLSREWIEWRDQLTSSVRPRPSSQPADGSPCFVLATSKPWHRDTFDRLSSEQGGQWEWASTPDELTAAVTRCNPRYVFFLHWNWRVPAEVWSKHECVCFHMTDVPYGRGGSPLQNLIKAGKEETKLTALRMEQEMDAGPVYTKRHLSLSGRAEDIYLRAGEISADIIRWMVRTQPVPVRQHGEVTTFVRRRPEQSVLPVRGSIRDLYDHIRMLDAPTYPVAFLDYGEFRVELTSAELVGDALAARALIRIATEHKDGSTE